MTMSEKIIAETAPFQMISQKRVLENEKDKVKKEQKKTKDTSSGHLQMMDQIHRCRWEG